MHDTNEKENLQKTGRTKTSGWTAIRRGVLKVEKDLPHFLFNPSGSYLLIYILLSAIAVDEGMFGSGGSRNTRIIIGIRVAIGSSGRVGRRRREA